MAAGHLNLREIHLIGAATRERLLTQDLAGGLSAAGVVCCGRSWARPPFRFVRHQPRIAQVLACVSGRGLGLVDGRWHDVGAGQAYLTPPGMLHAYHALPGEDWVLVWAHLADFASRDAPRRPMIAPRDASGFSSAIDGMLREADGSQDGAVERAWAELVGVEAHRLLRPEQSGDVVLERLWAEVDATLARTWTLAGLAVRAGIGPEQLRRRCLKACGRSPMAQVRHLRMRRAAALLSQTCMGIAATAAAVGYADAFAFSQAFRRSFGRPPSRWRLHAS